LNTNKLSMLLLAGLIAAAVAGCASPAPDLPTTLTVAAAQATVAPTTETPPPATSAATATPTAVPAPTETPPPSATPVPAASFNGVEVALDPALASGISGHVEPASGTSEGVDPWGIHPAYTQLDLIGYDSQNTYFQPHIAVYPVAGLEGMSPQAAQVVQALRELLAARPAASEGSIPLLPIFNAAQMLRAQVQYVDFQNGSGVRFLTQYDQAYLPINNHELFYTFQGLTADGACYVSAILPVAASFLPEDENPETVPPEGGLAFPAWTAPDFEAQALAYLEAMTQKLDEAPGGEFTPDPAALDAMIRSLQVSPP
jgi:hypothetical protein